MKQARGTLDWPMGMEIRRLGERRGLVPCFVMMDACHEMDERRGMYEYTVRDHMTHWACIVWI